MIFLDLSQVKCSPFFYNWLCKLCSKYFAMRVRELKLASLSSVIFVQRQFCCNKAPKGFLLPLSPLWEYRHEITEFATKKKAVQSSKTKTILWTNCSVKKKLERNTNLIAFFVFARIVKTCRNHWFVFPNPLHGTDLSWNHWERVKFGDVTKTILVSKKDSFGKFLEELPVI